MAPDHCPQEGGRTFLLRSPPLAADIPLTTATEADGGHAAMRKAVKDLCFGEWGEKEKALMEIERIARHGGTTARKALNGLGVIPRIVRLLDCGDECRRNLAALALVQLGDGSHSNRALMAEAGLLERLEKLASASAAPHVLPLLLSISSHPTTPLRISASLLSMLAATLATATDHARRAALSALFNLSANLHGARAIAASGVVPDLLRLSAERPSSAAALATLANLATMAAGRKAIEGDPSAPGCLLEAVGRGDMARCQELACSVVLVLVRGSVEQRRKVKEAGGVAVLLEAALLGSAVARRAAAAALRWVRDGSRGAAGEEEEVEVHRREMRRMVRQSLDKNMECLMRRAGNGSHGVGVLMGRHPSKSLAY